MNHQKSELYFLLALLLVVLGVVFFIFKPFFVALTLAIVFGVVFKPLHVRVLSLVGKNRGLAAFLSSICILVIVLVPVTLLSLRIFHEASGLYSSFVDNGGTTVISSGLSESFQKITGVAPAALGISLDVDAYLQGGLQWIVHNLGSIFSNVLQIGVGVFIFLIALYYMFKDGLNLKKAFVALSPLRDVHDELIFKRLALAINSVIKGSIVVALVQGVLTAIGFALFGIPNAILWGSVAAVAALIPGFGTALVIFPGVLFLFFSGETFQTVGLLIWGAIAVGLVDNFLGPKLVERGVQLHPFLILLSIFGGLSFFGPLGFLLGPLTLSLLFALLEIYFEIHRSQ